MSTVIDSKVVEMKFDNSKFESNVKTTMSTLDKLKLSLAKISGKHASLDIDTSGSNKNILSLGSAAETVSSKFTALEAVAFGALAKIGSQALVAGEQLIKSLSTDNIAAGWAKYDEKTSSVQTLVNSTGKSVDEINKYLDRLMWYSDETSYSFTEMTSALAQMTSTGGDIDKLIPTITGIANATAFAGKSGEAFNHTIRNITQSYNAGYLQLMDWKSLNLAGTSSKQLTEELIRAAEELGTVEKGFLTVENFAERLRDKNITTDVMDLAFSRFSAMSEEAYKLVESGQFDTASEAIEAIADDFDMLASRAFKSAQEAKTFKEAIDATKDAVSSGWMETFEIIFGNYEQAKDLWTDIANRMWDFFAGGAEGRNKQLSAVMSGGWDNLTAKIEECGVETSDFERELEKILTTHGLHVDTIKDRYGDLQSWFEQSDGRYNKYIGETLNNMAFATEKWSDQKKLTADNLKAFDDIVSKVSTGKIKDVDKATNELAETLGIYYTSDMSEALGKFFDTGGRDVIGFTKSMEKCKTEMIEMSKAEHFVYESDEGIEAFQELAISARDADSEVGQLIDTLNRPTGREMLLNSLFNVLDSFEAVVAIVKDAFVEIFPPTSALTIQNVIALIEKLTEKMKDFFTNEEKADKLKRTFKGLFAVLDIVKIVFTDIGKILLSIIQPLFGKTNNSVLDFTASLGDNLVAIRDWIKANDKVGVLTAWLSNKVEKAVTTFKNLTKEGGALNKVYKTMSDHLAKIKDSFAEWLKGLIEAEDKPKYIIDSLVSAFEDNIPKFKEAAEKAITAIIETLQDDIDNGKFNEAGKAALDSFINGFNKDGEDSVLTAFKKLGQKLLDKAKDLPWEKIFALGLSFALMKVLTTMGSYINKITSMLSPLKGILTNASNVLSSISGMFTRIGKAIQKEATGDMALKFAEAIAIIVGCITVLAFVPADKAWTATGIIATIIATFALALVALNVSMGLLTNLNPAGYISQVLAYVALIGALTVFISAIAGVIALISKAGDLTKGILVVSGIFVALIGIIALIAFLAPKLEEGTWAIGALSVFIKSLGVFMLETAVSMRLIGSMDKDAFERASGFFAGMMAFILILMVVAMAMKDIPKEMDYFGKGMAAIGAAMILAAVAMKIIGSMDNEALKKGYVFLVTMGIFIGVMMALTKKIAWQKAMVNFGKMMIQLGAALILTAVAMKIMGNLSAKEMAQGISFIFAFMIFTQAMAKVTATGGKTVLSFSKMMMSLGVALLLMSISVKLLGGMKTEELKKGELAVLGLALIMRLLIRSFKGFNKEAPKIAASLIACGICIGIMALVTFLIGQVSPETLTKGLIAVGILSVFLALLIRSTKGLENNKQLINNFIAIGVLIAALAAIVLLLSILEPEEALASAGSLAMVMTALIGLVAVASKAKFNKTAWKSFLAIGILLAEITGILFILSNFGNVEALIPSAVAIGTLLLALSASMLILNKIKGVSAQSLIAITIMGAIAFEIGLVLNILSSMPIQGTIEQAIAIGILIDLLSVAMIALGAAGETAWGVWNGILAFEVFIAATTALITGIGGLFNHFSDKGWNEALDKGIEVLTKVGEAIGGFFGGILAGFGNELLTLLPNAGTALSEFYENATPFIEGMATLPAGVAEGAEALASALLKITAGEALNALINAFFGEEVMSGEQLEKSFTAIGSALKAFSTSVSGFSDDDVEAISKAAKAAESLTSFISNLPAEGGWKQKILGEQDLGKFSTNLKSFAYALQVFSEKAKEIDADAITNAANAAMGLADFANALPEYTNGTLKGFVMGDKQNIQEFGSMLGTLADGLITFSQKSADISPDEIKKSAEAAEDLATLANNLPETGGKFGDWFGADHIDIGTFGDQLEDLADGLVELSESGKGIVSESMARVLDAVEKLAAIAVSLAGADFSIFGSDSISKLGEELPGLGQSLVSFGTSVYQLSASTSNISYALDNISKVADIVLQMQGIDYNYIYSFKDALNSLSQFDMKGLINTFSVEGVDNVGKAGKQLVASLQEGIVGSAEDVKKTTGVIMTAMLNTIHTKYEDMHNTGFSIIENLRSGMRMGTEGLKHEAYTIALEAQRKINDTYRYFVTTGEHLMNGLMEGMDSKQDALVTRAGEIASMVLKTMQAGFEEKSPSKATYRMGRYLDEGLINGIKHYEDKVYESATQLSEKTLEGFSTNLDKVYEVIDGDLNPVITPILNLDYVKKGVNDINSMFSSKALNADANLQNGVDMAATNGATISFTQINNSPKALSRIDIYRQTKNQIAQMKGALS